MASVFSVALSLGISAFAQAPAEDDGFMPELGVEWAYQPDSLSDLIDESPAVVMAEVEAVRPGEPVILAGAESEDPATVPTSLVDLQVTDAVSGQAPSQFTLNQLGGNGLHAEGDPGYHVGESYLLFVEPRHDAAGNLDGTWLPVAPDGRLENTGATLQAKADGPVADELDGASPAEAKQEITDVEGGAS